MNIKQAAQRVSPDLIIQAEKRKRLVKLQRFNVPLRQEPLVDSLLFPSFMSPCSAPRFLQVSREKVRGRTVGREPLRAMHEQRGMKLNHCTCNLRSLSWGLISWTPFNKVNDKNDVWAG